MAKGLLAVAFVFSLTNADEFHDWYDLEHLPERQAISGFGACERWLGADEPNYAVATYDLETVGVLESDAYLAVAYDNSSPWTKRMVGQCRRLLRFEGEQLTPGDGEAPAGAGGLLLNAMNVTPEAEADFNAWYDDEHLPALGAVPGCLSARRYRSTEAGGGTHEYVAIYHLESPDVARSEAWATAASTPWSERVRPHFRDRLRILSGRYRRSA
ncbi:MAG: antibiotic biosynthesis monooxygenase [Alphaproteobacteria bacterium]|nr:antibiotic biosynthesis monooxygenase [Alphaproteobacteria bacterium]